MVRPATHLVNFLLGRKKVTRIIYGSAGEIIRCIIYAEKTITLMILVYALKI